MTGEPTKIPRTPIRAVEEPVAPSLASANGHHAPPSEVDALTDAIEALGQLQERGQPFDHFAVLEQILDRPVTEHTHWLLQLSFETRLPDKDLRHQLGVLAADRRKREREQAKTAMPIEPDGYHLSDLGNARRFVAQHHETLRYSVATGWLAYTGQRWLRDPGETHVMAGAKDTVLTLLDTARAEPDDAKRQELTKWAAKSQGRRHLCDLIYLARSEPAVTVRPEELDADRWALNTPTGTLNLRTGACDPHRPEDLITKMTRVAYEPEATCPRWEALMARAFPQNPELILFLQRLAGLCLTGATERCLVFFWGSGDNCKTTLLETWRAVLGDYALATPMTTLMAKRDATAGIPNDVARFPGRRLITSVESEVGQRFAEALVKYLTGGDKQVARFLFKEFFEFDPTYKLVIASNNRPDIKGTDNAIWNRVKLVPFLEVIPKAEQIKAYHEMLVATEGPGILNWMLAGCRAYQADGLGVPTVVEEATAGYRAEQNRLADFLADCCVRAPDATVLVGDLYEVYKHWCGRANEHALSQKAMGTELEGRGYRAVTGAKGKRYRGGLRLMDGWQRYAEGVRLRHAGGAPFPIPSPLDLAKERPA